MFLRFAFKLRALEANNAVEWEFNHLAGDSAATESASDAAPPEDSVAATAVGDSVAADVGSAGASPSQYGSAGELPSHETAVPARTTPKQVIEAALFVGGPPLTLKKLCYVLRGDYDLEFVEQAIDDLNQQYLHECRPYEIRLGEGGYRLVLHEEFQRLRNRVYGIGPREVKLSQDVLEVLALVAYRQPITQPQIEELGKTSPGPVLRQLLRRELISLERDTQDRKQVKYRTTRRFLSVFGLGNLDELPQADDLMFK